MNQIQYISSSRFKEILSSHNIKKQLSDLGFEHKFNTDWLFVPLGCSNRLFIDFGNDNLDYLNQYKDIIKIFKEKHIELTINNFGRLIEIKKLLPDDFSHINFKYIDVDSTEIAWYSISEIINNSDWINLTFIQIYQSSMLSNDAFQFWWNVLRSKRTRFNITQINLKLNLFSECLTVLSLCLGCPELKHVELKYSEADTENEDEVVEQTKREFRQKFGFIQKLDIWKNKRKIV